MEETSTFTKYVGGSPANICIGMARLGLNTGFIGKVADDQMGRFITKYLENNGIATKGVSTDYTGAVTGLALPRSRVRPTAHSHVPRQRRGLAGDRGRERRADRLRQNGADLRNRARGQSFPEAVFLALDYAKRHGAVIAFDLDYRPYTEISARDGDLLQFSGGNMRYYPRHARSST